MKKPLDPAELRRRAEQRFEGRRGHSRAAAGTPVARATGLTRGPSGPPPEEQLPRLIQELEIHQFELEIQNEELQGSRDELATLLAQYTELYELAPVPYFTLAPGDAIQRVNRAGAVLLDAEGASLVGRRFSDFVAREARPAFTAFLTQAAQSSSKLTSEVALTTASNRPLHVQVEAAGSGDGGGCRVELLDTTERKRAAAALEASEACYRLLFESSNDGILLLDAGSGTLISANPSLCRLLARSADSFPGKTFWELDPFTGVVATRQAFVELQGRGGLRETRLSFEADDGRHVDVELRSHTYRVGRGHVMQLSLRDIGEHLRSERELASLQEQLQLARRLEAVGRLAGGVAHEFNNQLGVVIGYVDLLRASLPPGESGTSRLERIEKAAQHCAELTKQLLAFARKQVLQPQCLAPSALVADTAPLLSRLVGGSVAVTLRLEAVGRVRVDPDQLERVLIGLTSNARDAMPKGGTLSIETADVVLTSADTERYDPMPPGPYVTVTVRDTGEGLDALTRSRIFEPFFTTKSAGTGLGLAVVYGTVKQSGGYLWVESDPGHGTSFCIYLPRQEQPAARPPALESSDSPAIRTVLVVEDEDGLREWIVEALSDEGYEVFSAASGEDAVALASRAAKPVDLLLTDVVMGKLGGPAAARRIQAQWPTMRVLFMSGFLKEDLSDRGALAPDDALIQKPFTPGVLLEKLSAMGGSKSNSSAGSKHA